ncbi:MAG: HEAT repeat domain-containing protein [Candidatus Ozemobacteraceae bacterium]
MSMLLEQRISAYQVKSFNALSTLIEAPVPMKVKLLAVNALSRVKTPEAREKVCAFFSANPEEEDAIGAVYEVGGDEAAQLLMKCALEQRSPNRDILTERVGMLKTTQSLDVLKELLGDNDRHVRHQAIFGLFHHGGREAALALCKYISDPDEWISMTILKLLCRMKEHESIPFLAEQFTKDTDLRRKAQMVNFLSMFKSVTLVNIFDEGLKSHDARLKANAIEAFGELELPQREIAARISPYLEDPNNRIRANAILALARSESERTRPKIVLMVSSDDVQLRRSAAFILGQISSDGNEELAEKLIGDASDDVRRRMVLSLRKFPREFVIRMLEKSVADANSWIRKHSIDLAAGFPEFPLPPILKQIKNETAYPNLVACMEFFGRHPDQEASRLIRARVKDKRDQVVSAVIRAVGAIHGLQGLQALAPQINYRDPRILKTFASTHFGLGGLDVFPSILEKAVLVKKNIQIAQNDLYLPAVEGCLELLALKEKMPPLLKAELSREPEPEPIAVVEPETVPVPSATIEATSKSPEGLQYTPAGNAPFVAAGTFSSAEGGASDEDRDSKTHKVRTKVRLPAGFSAGLKQYNLGKYGKAKKGFYSALEEQPDLIKAHFYLGMIAWEEREMDQARQSLSIFLESEPDNAKALLTLGKVYKQMRDWPGVVRVYGKLAERLDDLPKKTGLRILRELGVAQIFLKKYPEAREILEVVFKQDPTDTETNFNLAMAYFHLQNYMRSETLLRDLVRQLPPEDKMRTMVDSLLEKLRAVVSQAESSGAFPGASPAPGTGDATLGEDAREDDQGAGSDEADADAGADAGEAAEEDDGTISEDDLENEESPESTGMGGLEFILDPHPPAESVPVKPPPLKTALTPARHQPLPLPRVPASGPSQPVSPAVTAPIPIAPPVTIPRATPVAIPKAAPKVVPPAEPDEDSMFSLPTVSTTPEEPDLGDGGLGMDGGGFLDLSTLSTETLDGSIPAKKPDKKGIDSLDFDLTLNPDVPELPKIPVMPRLDFSLSDNSGDGFGGEPFADIDLTLPDEEPAPRKAAPSKPSSQTVPAPSQWRPASPSDPQRPVASRVPGVTGAPAASRASGAPIPSGTKPSGTPGGSGMPPASPGRASPPKSPVVPARAPQAPGASASPAVPGKTSMKPGDKKDPGSDDQGGGGGFNLPSV